MDEIRLAQKAVAGQPAGIVQPQRLWDRPAVGRRRPMLIGSTLTKKGFICKPKGKSTSSGAGALATQEGSAGAELKNELEEENETRFKLRPEGIRGGSSRKSEVPPAVPRSAMSSH